MRTLDEVIKAVEIDLNCAHFTYPESFYDYDNHKDALYYLKEYQEKRDEICEIAKIMADSWELHKQTMAFEDRNDPISWSELQEMDGKPVWVERNVCDGFKEWCLVHARFDDEIWFADENGTIFRYSRDEYGKIWVTYRKERS